MIQKSLFGAGLLACTALLGSSASAQITLTAGDVALIGWVDNGTPADILTFVNLAPIPAGSKIYFTDNGWDSVGLAFRNTLGLQDGDGNEQLLMFTAVNAIPAGTIISTTDTSANFTFTTSGLIFGTGVTTGNYAVPALAQTGDQVYVFQHDTGDNVLNTPTQEHLFVLDDTGTFEPATSAGTGDIPPTLSVAAGTALTFTQNGTGQNFMAFNTSALSGGSKAQWLAAIADVNNWTFGATGTLPTGTITINGGISGGTPFCFGDGSGTACPCGNNSVVGSNTGCLSSLAVGGKLVATGTGSISGDTIVLAGTQMPNSSALYFQGTSQSAAGAGTVFGDGLRCAAGSVIRLGTKANAAGASQYPALGDPSVSTKGFVVAPGTRVYQVWYRNAAAFCTVSTFNLSNGWQIVWAL